MRLDTARVSLLSTGAALLLATGCDLPKTLVPKNDIQKKSQVLKEELEGREALLATKAAPPPATEFDQTFGRSPDARSYELHDVASKFPKIEGDSMMAEFCRKLDERLIEIVTLVDNDHRNADELKQMVEDNNLLGAKIQDSATILGDWVKSRERRPKDIIREEIAEFAKRYQALTDVVNLNASDGGVRTVLRIYADIVKVKAIGACLDQLTAVDRLARQ